MSAGGYAGAGFALIVILFILLILVGCGCFGGYSRRYGYGGYGPGFGCWY